MRPSHPTIPSKNVSHAVSHFSHETKEKKQKKTTSPYLCPVN